MKKRIIIGLFCALVLIGIVGAARVDGPLIDQIMRLVINNDQAQESLVINNSAGDNVPYMRLTNGSSGFDITIGPDGINASGIPYTKDSFTIDVFDVVENNQDCFMQSDVCCSDGECSDELLQCNGKTCFVKDGFGDGIYNIKEQVHFTEHTTLIANGNPILNLSDTHGTTYNTIVASKGLILDGFIVNGTNDCSPCSKWTKILINGSFPELTSIKNNQFYDVSLQFRDGDVTKITKFNAVVKDNYFEDCVSMSVAAADGIKILNNVINQTHDSSWSVNACGKNHQIIGNEFYHSSSAGAPIELTQDGTCGLIENIKIIGNTLTGDSGYGYLISESGDTSDNQIKDNYIYNTATDVGGIVSHSNNGIISGNIINSSGTAGIRIIADTREITDISVKDNTIISSGDNTDFGAIRIHANGYNITRIDVIGNHLYDSPRGIQINIESGSKIQYAKVFGNTINSTVFCMKENNAGLGMAFSKITQNSCLGNESYDSFDSEVFIDQKKYTTLPSCNTWIYGESLTNTSGGAYSRSTCIDGTWYHTNLAG